MWNQFRAGASNWDAICRMTVRLLGVGKLEQGRLRKDLLYSQDAKIVGWPGRLMTDVSLVGPSAPGTAHFVTIGGNTVRGLFCEDVEESTWYGPQGEVVKLTVHRQEFEGEDTIGYELEEEGVFLATWLDAVVMEFIHHDELSEDAIRKFATDRKFVAQDVAAKLLRVLKLAPA